GNDIEKVQIDVARGQSFLGEVGTSSTPGADSVARRAVDAKNASSCFNCLLVAAKRVTQPDTLGTLRAANYAEQEQKRGRFHASRISSGLGDSQHRGAMIALAKCPDSSAS